MQDENVLEPIGNQYVIRLQGHLDERRWRHFEGWTITLLPDGETLLRGPIADQAALHGILNRIRDMGVRLLEVRIYGDSRRIEDAG